MSRKTIRAGITFPVGRIGRYLREKHRDLKIRDEAAVFFAATMEYICAEVLDAVTELCLKDKKKIIKCWHID